MVRGDPANTSPKPSKKDNGESKNEDDEQSARFIETARQLGVDETGKKFDLAFKGITRAVPPSKK